MTERSASQMAARQLKDLPQTLIDCRGWVECRAALQDGGQATFDAAWGSSCALLAAALAVDLQQPLLVIAANENDVDRLVDDFSNFSSLCLHRFPASETGPLADLTSDPNYGERLALLKSLARGGRPPVLAASIQSLMQHVPSPTTINQGSRALATGQTIDLAEVRRWLVESGYQSTTAVRLPGEFSSRGGILDVFAPDARSPVRIELFDDEIESIRFFDIDSQRSTQKCQAVEVSGSLNDPVEADLLFSFLPPETVVLLFEPTDVLTQARTFSTGSAAYCSLEAIQGQWGQRPLAQAGRLIPPSNGPHCRLPIRLIEAFSGDIGDIRSELDRTARDHDLFLITATESETTRVKEILESTQAKREGRVQYSNGILHAGFRLEQVPAIVLGTDQLFGRQDLRRTLRRRGSKPIDSFVDLRDGDLVVHLSHGIGRFRGLKVLAKEGHRTEHLELEFHAGTRIYVPATKIGLVQKYVGGTKMRPRLARIGNKTWVKQKAAAAEAVNDLAAEMLELQAARSSRTGIAFGVDTAWQYEFEHSFPYHETNDQLLAIDGIKSGMESPMPMDRLLCGDVGFGKTEVAMRAAFKAVENGYQVAVLVPTTVLAEQHHRTFRDRMAEFPVDVAKLSRFCTAAEQRETVAGLKSGQIDIVIGTHRLTSKDITFSNLGLVIIDEEQRFGVEHKERLKSLRAEVDVLTMSATPIPRTLHMSLVGVRDISNLETPPEDRLAVQTRVTKFDPQLIRDAIMRELSRGGQVFFVHNRVNDIHLLKQQLQYLVPEASVVVGHGQMAESELEQAMTSFINGKHDVLLATTIIENGLDIPNANTMFVNEAERYGLADLHQLRGRVGRYKNKAYCYLMVQPHKHVNPNAAKRLQAIEQYSEMGAGFAIAMRDLEIRGAGNLLGTEQSGHIASVGYELYCQLLESAVRALKRLPAKISLDVDVDLPIEAYLPDEYVVDRRQKVDIYRRLHRIEKFDEISSLRRELRDRFGPLPAPTKRLLKLAETRLEASLWQIECVFLEEKYLGIRFTDSDRMKQLAAASQFNLRIVDDHTAYLTLRSENNDPDRLLSLVKSILQATSAVA